MASVADLVDPEGLKVLARPSNLRLGQQIVDADGVELVEFTPLLVRGRVQGAGAGTQGRTTELRANGQTLEWECTCSRNPKLFCKHAVALAAVTWSTARQRRSKG